MKNIPMWQDIKTKKYSKLNKSITTDILIVGGGIAGISAFYHLKDDKRKVILVEKNRIGYGATSRSSAKITFLQENIYSKLMDNFGIEIAKKYYDSQKDAIDLLNKVCQREKIDCDLEKVSSYIYTVKKDEIAKIEREKEILNSFGEFTNSVKKLPNGMLVKNGFKVNNTYVFHPLKFVSELAKRGISNNHKIYEDTRVVDVRYENGYYICYTLDSIIKCKYLIYTTHYPAFIFPYLFPLKAYIEKSYIIATKNNNQKFSAINLSNPLLSMRYYQDNCLYIGGSHNLCFKNNNRDNFKKINTFDSDAYEWSNHDVMSLDYLPYIGFIKDNLLIATGFNTWGMTNGFLSGIILSDLIKNKKSIYQELFNPHRGFSKDALVHYPIDIFSSAYSLINSKINLNKAWYNHNPYFTKINGERVAIYKDQDGKEHIVYPKCPHFKCNLLFNEVEKTWDCPCHGSRFDLDGKSIMGPSNYDVSYKKD